jgi:hypothetical protein
MPKVDEQCNICHKTAHHSISSLDNNMPKKDSCLKCHERDYEKARCSRCHKDLKGYDLENIISQHRGSDFMKMHSTYAIEPDSDCFRCHGLSFCSDCHSKTTRLKPSIKYPQKVDRNFIHRGDFIAKHGIKARLQPEMCTKCHGVSFCTQCHKRSGLDPSEPSAKKWHSEGWLYDHGIEARHDILSCASCHEMGTRTKCIKCHMVGGIGGRPHPPGWERKFSHKDRRENPMCFLCHP